MFNDLKPEGQLVPGAINCWSELDTGLIEVEPGHEHGADYRVHVC